MCLRGVYLALNPIGMAHAALTWGLDPEHATSGPPAELHLAAKDREWIDRRLGALPPVREQDFFALTTRVEALEIAVAALGERMAAAGVADSTYDDDDYASALHIDADVAPAGALLN